MCCFLFSYFFIGFFVSLCVVKKSAKKERKDAINRSRAVLSGQMLEQVAPFLPDFPCNPADVRFVGKPIDFVAFANFSTLNTPAWEPNMQNYRTFDTILSYNNSAFSVNWIPKNLEPEKSFDENLTRYSL